MTLSRLDSEGHGREHCGKQMLDDSSKDICLWVLRLPDMGFGPRTAQQCKALEGVAWMNNVEDPTLFSEV